MLAQIANIPAQKSELRWWAFGHMAHHRDICRRIVQTTGIALPEFILDPFDPENRGVWIDQHQQMHNAMNRVLGLPGNDLLAVDWQDQGQLSAWIWLNFTEHLAASNELGV